MKKAQFVLLTVSLLATPFLMGMAAVGVKQFSRKITEDTLKAIKVCESTDKDVFKLLRKPTDDFTTKQGDYTIYTYYGFTSGGGTKKQKLEVMLNKENVVVDSRLNYEGAEPMTDKCAG